MIYKRNAMQTVVKDIVNIEIIDMYKLFNAKRIS